MLFQCEPSSGDTAGCSIRFVGGGSVYLEAATKLGGVVDLDESKKILRVLHKLNCVMAGARVPSGDRMWPEPSLQACFAL